MNRLNPQNSPIPVHCRA